MSDEIEAAGAMTTAALVATALPPAAGGDDSENAHVHACSNCGTPLTGAFCSSCGQRAHIHRSLLHLAEEVLHGVSHFDAKGWRTLPLLVARPGLLTRRYIDGQRTRYVSPLALFLFTVFLMFVVFSFTTGSIDDLPNPRSAAVATSRAALEDAAKQGDAKVTAARAALEKAKREDGDITDAADDLASAVAEQNIAKMANGAVVKGWRAGLREMEIDTGNVKLDASIRRATANPDLTLYKLKNTAYKFSFMLVPISLPFLWLMFFWRRGVSVYDHAVFTLYSLSFMSLLFVVAALLSVTRASDVVPVLLFFVPPVHMFMQLREAYGLKFFATLWRTFALVVVALTVFILFTMLIITLTMG
ncbi:MAG: DUF3667 domain-containing protein [Rhizobacter sp.]